MSMPGRRLEPLAQRVRARLGKRILLDTTHAQLLFEDERHPWRAIPTDALLAALAGPPAAPVSDRSSPGSSPGSARRWKTAGWPPAANRCWPR